MSRWATGTLHLPAGKKPRVIDTQAGRAGNGGHLRGIDRRRYPVRGDAGTGSPKTVGSDPAGDISVPENDVPRWPVHDIRSL